MRPILLARAYTLTDNRADAEDLVGETYLTLIAKPPEPRSPAALRAWMRTVMANKRRDHWRNIARGLADPLDYEPLDLDERS